MHQSKRVYGLDLLRAIAIIHVVLLHGAHIVDTTVLEGFPWISIIDGVDIFFALSGYLIGTILLKEINSVEIFSFKDLWRFWCRRWLRTLPNYYLILLANYVVVKTGIIAEHISQFNWKFFVFLQNFNKPFVGFFWESWTLSVEEWFYLSAPLLLLLTLRFLKPKKAFLLVTLIMLLAPMLQRFSMSGPHITYEYWEAHFRKLVITRVDSIAYGLLAAWVFYYYRSFWEKYRIPFLVAGILTMVFVLNFPSPVEGIYAQVFMFPLSSIAAMLLIPFAEGIKSYRTRVGKWITHISIISYSMYLINGALVSEVIRDNFTPEGQADRIFKYMVYWTAVIFFSTLVNRFFEKPIMNLRDRKIPRPVPSNPDTAAPSDDAVKVKS
jgi:peptidoglycan/LPS O-acetylase OafA/YrhL